MNILGNWSVVNVFWLVPRTARRCVPIRRYFHAGDEHKTCSWSFD